MNNVTIIGQIDGDARIAYTTENGAYKLYKFILKVPRPLKKGQTQIQEDFINVKCWSNKLVDEDNLHDQAFVGIEGRLQSFGAGENKNYGNEVVATKILYLE